MPLLAVDDLHVSFPTADGIVRAVGGVSFSLEEGETLGIVGESGSGKSVCVQTLMGLTGGADVSGTAMFDGKDLLNMSEDEMRGIRGAQIAMIFQDPLSSLHPQYRVGWQISEAIRAHRTVGKAEAREQSIELLKQVGIPQPEKRVDCYPHEMSGGMRQRVMIAMALALRPKLLIADEPTTAIDVTVQAQILELITELQQELHMALIMITHDLGVIAEIADRVVVMYGGRVMEAADRDTLYYHPHHPYTNGLLESIPSSTKAKERLRPIAGQPPSLIRLPSGCPFNPRCAYVMDRCVNELPPLLTVAGDKHESACWLSPDLVGTDPAVDAKRAAEANAGRSKPLVAEGSTNG